MSLRFLLLGLGVVLAARPVAAQPTVVLAEPPSAARVATAPLRAVYSDELVPGPDGDVDAHIRNLSSTLWHPAGTCQMGTGDAAVVDPDLRVRGIDGLRVADASVMPRVTSGNTLAACYMIAEKTADLLMA